MMLEILEHDGESYLVTNSGLLADLMKNESSVIGFNVYDTSSKDLDDAVKIGRMAASLFGGHWVIARRFPNVLGDTVYGAVYYEGESPISAARDFDGGQRIQDLILSQKIARASSKSVKRRLAVFQDKESESESIAAIYGGRKPIEES